MEKVLDTECSRESEEKQPLIRRVLERRGSTTQSRKF